MSADVVERIYRQARSALGCPKPPPGELRALSTYVVDKVMHTRGEYVTLSTRLLRRYVSAKLRLAVKCVIAWLGLEDCVALRMRDSKVVLSLSCVKEKLGIKN